MGTRLFKVSDITGKVVEDETQLNQLIVEHHPNFEEPIGLELLPEDIEGDLPETQEYVAFSYAFPGAPEPRRYVLPVEEFNRLFPNGNAEAILQRALAEQQQLRAQAGRGGTKRQSTSSRRRVDYTRIEHAGEPHRGTVSETEKEVVRSNLDEVNRRLKEKGMRLIDASDPEMAERYGFTPAVGV